ncbi:MAG: hypothetical protein B6242_15385 [Anaerolineaceae bacterium 4572_78]|nr:MAG: hypothetical protein B6242_15385 [Anaerolineaceae bacterium 4572_78]
MTHITVSLPSEFVQLLPKDQQVQVTVIRLGLQQLRIEQALQSYGQGQGTLAYAAQQAGVSIRKMICLAYAIGLTPKTNMIWLSDNLSVKEAMNL